MGWYKQSGEYCLKENKLYTLNDADAICFLGKYNDYKWVLSGHDKRIPIKFSSEVESAYKLETWAEVNGFPMRIWRNNFV